MTSSTRQSRRIACLLLSLPILVVCSPFLFSSRDLVAHDFREYFGPHAELARIEFRASGELPRWNPCQYAGVPFVGTGQNNLYYPPSLLFLVLPVARAFGLLVALHLLLASVGTYRLARSYGLSRDSAVLAGVAYGMSFTLIAHASAGHVPNFVTMCQVPMLLALLRRAILRPSVGGGVALAFGGALTIVAASPQLLYQAALFCAALAIVELRSRGRALGPAIGVLAGGMTGALALSAVHLLPLFETAAASNRSTAQESLIQPFHDFDVLQGVLLSVPRFFWHPASDPWLWHEKAMYLGLLPVMLSAVALRSRSAPVFFYGAVALFAFLEALSGRFLGWLPWYGGFRLPERILWVAVLSLAILAGFGWQRLREEPEKIRRRAIAAAVVTAVWAVVLVFTFDVRGGLFLFAVVGACSVAAMTQAARWGLVAAVVVSLDLGGAALLEFQTAKETSPPPWYDTAIGKERQDWRLLDLSGYKASAVFQGFRLLGGYGHPVSPALSDLYASAWTSSVPSLDTLPVKGGALRDVTVLRDLNVRWIVGGNPPLHPDWKAIASGGGGLVLFEDAKARPMAFFPDSAGSVQVRRPGANHLELRVTAERAAEVVVSEAWAPGWQARLDGRPIELQRYRGALMALQVPAGESHIVMSYDPAGWRTGRWVTGAALLGALVVLGRRVLRRP